MMPALLLAAVAAAPVRVATLLPYVQDALAGLGPGVAVVAAARRDLRTPPTPPVVDLGNPHSPSFESLAEAHPDVVVADRTMHGHMEDRLARGGTQVVLVDSGSVDTTLAGLRDVGRRVHEEQAMQARVDADERELAALKLPAPVPALLLFGAPGSFMVVSERTWLGDLARRLGFVNVGAGAAGSETHPGFVQVSDEVLAQLRPELVLLVAHGDPESIRAAFVRRLEAGGPWAALGGAARRGVHVLPADLFAANPGLRMVDAARALRTLGTTP